MVSDPLGWNFVFLLDLSRILAEGPVAGYPDWRVSYVVLQHNGALVVAETAIFPAGDRQRLASGEVPKNRQNDLEYQVGQWSRRPEAITDDRHPTVTQGMLRALKPTELLMDLRRFIEEHRNDEPTVDAWVIAAGLDPIPLGAAFSEALSNEAGDPGRPGRSNAYWAMWAQRYATVVQRGSRQPISDLAKEHRVSRNHIRDVIFRAREKGYLTGSTERQAGGRLTEKATAALKETDK